MRILPDGTVEIKNKRTGATKIVNPTDLPSYGISYSSYEGEKSAYEKSILGEEAPTAEEKKRVAKKETTETAVSLLEKLYFGEEGDDPLAYGVKGLGGRLGGVFASLKTKIAPSEESERITVYQRTLDSIRPQLAKAAGDAGNIALAEQIMAGKGLPQLTDTPEEAKGILQATREKFGLEPSKKIKTKDKKRRTAEELADRGFLENLLSLEGTKRYAQEAPGIAGRGVLKTGQNIMDLLRGDVGGAVQRGEEFRPEVERAGKLNEAAREEIAAKIETAAGIQALKGYLGPKIKQMFGAKAPELGKEALEEGVKMATKGKEIRNAAIKEAQEAGRKVDGNKIYSKIVSWADDASATANTSQRRTIRDFLRTAEKRFKGKMLSPETAKRRWDTAVKGYSTAGKAGKTVESGFNRAIRDGVRESLEVVAKGFDEGTQMIHAGLNEDKLLSGISKSMQRKALTTGLKATPSPLVEFLKMSGKGVARGAATGAGLYGIAKILGIDIPGAFREQQ